MFPGSTDLDASVPDAKLKILEKYEGREGQISCTYVCVCGWMRVWMCLWLLTRVERSVTAAHRDL